MIERNKIITSEKTLWTPTGTSEVDQKEIKKIIAEYKPIKTPGQKSSLNALDEVKKHFPEEIPENTTVKIVTEKSEFDIIGTINNN